MLEPRDKLDVTAVLDAITVADGGEVVNGPEGMPVDWQSIDWRRVEVEVERLRQRIFAASKARDLAKVRNLQKLILRSRANALLSVPCVYCVPAPAPNICKTFPFHAACGAHGVHGWVGSKSTTIL